MRVLAHKHRGTLGKIQFFIQLLLQAEAQADITLVRLVRRLVLVKMVVPVAVAEQMIALGQLWEVVVLPTGTTVGMGQTVEIMRVAVEVQGQSVVMLMVVTVELVGLELHHP